MGELYLAASGELGGAEKLCVIKMVAELDGHGDPAADPAGGPHRGRRLLDEARVMARLNHINLVQVFDTGLVDDDLYLAMELVAGRDLRAAWNRCADLQARIPVDMALYLVREVARGLAFAHGYGGLQLVHRDIAPPNILLSWQGEVKITDFGLAASRLKREQTGPGIVFGRLGYLSPEQARGEPVDRRTDIYALGVILWELLTGRPFIDPTLDPSESLRLIRGLEPLPPSRFAPDLPRSLDAVVMRALQPRREARYATADELRQAASRELLRLSPDADQGCVAEFLRGLYGDLIDQEQAEQERLLREELPRARLYLRTGQGHLGGAPGPPGAAPGPADETAEAQGRIGQIVDGRYRIDRVVGMGGMGAVYEAEHVAIRKKVALKILHRPFSQQAELVTRLRREAQAASRVGHPNIVDVTDFGYTPDGSAYLAMEFLEGRDLGQVLAERGRLVPERAVHITLQLVQALSAAHAGGVVHRDLKPENLFLINPEETAPSEGSRSPFSPFRDIVKVVDFGIAMRLEPTVPIRITGPGLTLGTPEYMAPEQATSGTVDERADIYATGALLYEMVTGQVPFRGDDFSEVLARKTREDPPSPRALEPNLMPALEAIILRCLQRDPAARPQSMEELAVDLQGVQAEMRLALGGSWSSLSVSGERRAMQALSDPGPRSDPGVSAPMRGQDPMAEPRSQPDGRVAVPMPIPPPMSGPVPMPPPTSGPIPPPMSGPMPGPVPMPGPISAPHMAPLPASTSLPLPKVVQPAQQARRGVLRQVGGILTGALLVGVGVVAARYLPGAHRRGDPVERPAAQDPVGSAGQGQGTPTAAASKERVEALLEWARRSAEGGRYIKPPGDNLVELLGRIEAQSPGNLEARRLREQAVAQLVRQGREALRERDTDVALGSYRALSALRADEPFPRSDLAQQLQLRARGRKAKARALEFALAAVEVTPESVQARLVLGETYLSLGQRERAAEEFRRALDLHPYAAEEKAARLGLNRAVGAEKPKKRKRRD
jgi:serine/threonine protein kinase